MGCGSSKFLVRSLSFQQELTKRLKNKKPRGGDQNILALLCSANSPDPKSIAAQAPSQEVIEEKNSSDPPPADHDGEIGGNIEVINAWELLAGLEDHEERDRESESEGEGEKDDYKFIIREDSEEKPEKGTATTAVQIKRCSKREAMARELAALKVPPAKPAFEFTKAGSLREWLQRGGQVASPGSYVTPKFGSYAAGKKDGSGGEKGDDDGVGDGDLVVFDPEMVAQFEQAMDQLATDEELVLRQITDN